MFTFSVDLFSHLVTFLHIAALSHLRVPQAKSGTPKCESLLLGEVLVVIYFCLGILAIFVVLVLFVSPVRMYSWEGGGVG